MRQVLPCRCAFAASGAAAVPNASSASNASRLFIRFPLAPANLGDSRFLAGDSLFAGVHRRRPAASAASLRPVAAREHGALRLLVHLGLEGVAVLEGDRLLRGRAGADLVSQALHVAK